MGVLYEKGNTKLFELANKSKWDTFQQITWYNEFCVKADDDEEEGIEVDEVKLADGFELSGTKAMLKQSCT